VLADDVLIELGHNLRGREERSGVNHRCNR
jgi:hypothetical protein